MVLEWIVPSSSDSILDGSVLKMKARGCTLLLCLSCSDAFAVFLQVWDEKKKKKKKQQRRIQYP